MPKDTTGVKGQTRVPLSEKILTILRRHYYDDYHLEYVRLLSLGVAPKEFPARLIQAGFGSHCLEAVEFHIETFYARLPELRSRGKAAKLLAKAYATFSKEPRRPPPEKPIVDSTWLPSPPHIPRAGTLGEKIGRSKWDLRAQPRRTKKNVDQASPSEVELISAEPSNMRAILPTRGKPRPDTRASSEKIPTSLVEIKAPSDDQLIAMINDMPPKRRAQLKILLTFEKPPSPKEISIALRMASGSASATVSAIFCSLELVTPKGIHRDLRKAWRSHRHERLRKLHGSPGIKPPREELQRHWGGRQQIVPLDLPSRPP